MASKIAATPREETVEEFLARGGHIERIEQYPEADGRVLLRGQRGRQQRSAPGLFNPPFHQSAGWEMRHEIQL
jgi:hypothetical protein